MPRFWFVFIVVALVSAAITGCSTNVEQADSPSPAAESAAPAGPAGPMASAPTAGGAGGHEEARQQVEQLEAAYKENPGDTGAKAKLISAKYEYASKLMDDAGVPPMQKYRPALKAFNEILALDPGHKEAATRKQAIEQVYRSMGREVPQ